VADIDRTVAHLQPPITRTLSRCDHGRLQLKKLVVPKCAGDGLPLPFPMCTISGQQALAERWPERPADLMALVQRIGVFHQCLMDERGIGQIDLHLARGF